MIELLLDTAAGRKIAMRIDDPSIGVHAPHLVDVEVIQVLRRLTRDRTIESDEAEAALDDLRALDLQRHAHEALLDRAWALRENLSAYDAVYVALAEALDAPLLTCDKRLSRASATHGRVELVS